MQGGWLGACLSGGALRPPPALGYQAGVRCSVRCFPADCQAVAPGFSLVFSLLGFLPAFSFEKSESFMWGLIALLSGRFLGAFSPCALKNDGAGRGCHGGPEISCTVSGSFHSESSGPQTWEFS